MINQDHTLAERFAAEASLLLREGRREEARARYKDAAEHERRALGAIPPEKVRTRGIIAVSAASLLYKARLLEQAEQLLYGFLGDSSFHAEHRSQLRELLEVIWDERALPAGTSYSAEEIRVSLRGGTVGYGTAPLDLALGKSTEIKNLLYRTAEWLGKEPFRRRGLPSKSILETVHARATQPAAGSYRFAIRLAESGQEGRAAGVTQCLFQFIRLATSAASASRQQLQQLVPDPDYRLALLKLVRNVTPSESELSEVELTRVYRADQVQAEEERQAVILDRESRYELSEFIQQESPPEEQREVELTGTLRALNLDQHWLIVAADDGRSQRCEAKDDVLDDVVGPMVNRRVVVRGVWRHSRGRRKFYLRDIELWAED
jgi:hypothetical protein